MPLQQLTVSLLQIPLKAVLPGNKTRISEVSSAFYTCIPRFPELLNQNHTANVFISVRPAWDSLEDFCHPMSPLASVCGHRSLLESPQRSVPHNQMVRFLCQTFPSSQVLLFSGASYRSPPLHLEYAQSPRRAMARPREACAQGSRGMPRHQPISASPRRHEYGITPSVRLMGRVSYSARANEIRSTSLCLIKNGPLFLLSSIFLIPAAVELLLPSVVCGNNERKLRLAPLGRLRERAKRNR